MNKYYKIKGFIKKLSFDLPLDALLRIFKSFVIPIMDYGGIIYDKPNNESFKNKIESIQYKAYINNGSNSRDIQEAPLSRNRIRIST